MKKWVEIFTDGSCLGNPGPGGYGAVLKYQRHTKELAEGFELTTNNRMELMAPIAALDALKKPCNISITTDSQYVRLGITRWIANWQKNHWQTAAKKPVKNVDLWQKLYQLSQQHVIEWHWVKGHSGHAENERCDELARLAAQQNQLSIDTGYQP